MHWMKSQIYCSDVHLVQVFDDDCLIIKYLSKASLSIFWSGIGDEKFAPFWQLQTTKNSFNCTVTSYFLCQVNDETKWCSRTSEMMNSVPISREMPPLMRSTKELSSLTKQSVACSDANPEDCPLSLSLSLPLSLFTDHFCGRREIRWSLFNDKGNQYFWGTVSSPNIPPVPLSWSPRAPRR